ncbi:MAG: hypothetical protein CMP48_03180 [Rickettsiales bacterium]|nr:hypothetical protein [Rickettsiales bacterium]
MPAEIPRPQGELSSVAEHDQVPEAAGALQRVGSCQRCARPYLVGDGIIGMQRLPLVENRPDRQEGIPANRDMRLDLAPSAPEESVRLCAFLGPGLVAHPFPGSEDIGLVLGDIAGLGVRVPSQRHQDERDCIGVETATLAHVGDEGVDLLQIKHVLEPEIDLTRAGLAERPEEDLKRDKL